MGVHRAGLMGLRPPDDEAVRPLFHDAEVEVRIRLGARLAEEKPAAADIVFAVPDSGNLSSRTRRPVASRICSRPRGVPCLKQTVVVRRKGFGVTSSRGRPTGLISVMPT